MNPDITSESRKNTAERRRELYSLLGPLPDRDLPVQCTAAFTEDRGSYTLEHLTLQVSGTDPEDPNSEPIPAIFARPKGEGPFPAVLFSHSHGGFYEMGKNELLHPAPYMYPIPYAESLTAMGIAVLAVDQRCFGEREGQSESFVFKKMILRGRVMWGTMVYDSLRALDYLLERPDVDPSRIAALGMSMGSTMSWWISALDERIKVCADICCLSDLQTLTDEVCLDDHGIYYFVPDLLNHFTTGDINSLIAPRAHIGIIGMYDRLTPPRGVDKIEAQLRDTYASLGASDHFSLLRCPCGHRESALARASILGFLKNYL